MTPESRVAGRLHPPCSKSILQRALVAAALADGVSELAVGPAKRADSMGDDVARAVEFARALGASVEHTGPALLVRGSAVSTGRRPRVADALNIGESGTLARFATAVLALHGEPGRELLLGARGTLRGRRSDALYATLRRAGAMLHEEGEGAWPVRIEPTARVPERLVLEHPRSSQELSALWLAGAAVGTPLSVEVVGSVPSAPYVEITRRVLSTFGATIGAERAGNTIVRGPLRAPSGVVAIEADASSAAVALAAACLTGGELVVTGVPAATMQGDARIVEHLRAFGYDARRTDDGLAVSGERNARGAVDELRIDLSGEPDLAPVLAIVAAAAARDGRATVLSGLGTLRGKESDRLAVLEELLCATDGAGWSASATDASLEVRPHGRRAEGGAVVVDPHGDHRIAFAGALLGLLLPNVRVSAPDCVAKSWPGFWRDLEGAGAVLVRN